MSDSINFDAKLNIKLNKHYRYLLAMSGGVDSVVLFHLLLQQGLDFQVAHVNYMLRGKDSNLDAEFVSNLCMKHKVKYYNKTADINTYKKSYNASTQIAAREIRYSWFKEIIKQNNLDYILTAHHLNDSIETFFINLLRGTGINGLRGINNQKYILRPLLNFTKNEILTFATKHNILWREDSSNYKNDYVRNKIRNIVIPEFTEINPDFLNNFAKTFEFVSNDILIVESYIKQIKVNLFHTKNNLIYIKISDLKNNISNPNIIFYLFESYGFKKPSEIVKLMSGNNSAELSSFSHRLIKDRDFLILKKIKNNLIDTIHLDNLNFENELIAIESNFTEKLINSQIISFDAKKLKFPLYLRKWRNGDIFYPSGMRGKSKKVSKFFKDLKFSKIQKENTWLLCDTNDNIVWVVNHRADERFISTEKTKKWYNILKLNLH